jgi:small conductance mechanosensitive channel
VQNPSAAPDSTATSSLADSVAPLFSPETFSLVVDYSLRIAGFIVILVVVNWIAGRVRGLVRKGLDRPRFDKTLARFLGNFAYYVLFVLGLFVALGTLGVDTGSFVAALAAVGFAIGLALQGTLANFSAGVMLLIFRPFNVDDYIDAGGVEGFVREVQLFYTRIDTHDRRHYIVPNSEIFGSTIMNLSYHDAVRVGVDVGTDYPADLDVVRDVLVRAAESVEGRIEARGVQAYLAELGGSSINWNVRVWSHPDDLLGVKDALTRALKVHLDEAEIGIPYPQMDVHLDRTDQPVGGDGAAG